MKKTILLLAVFSLMMSPLLSQVTVQAKEVKRMEVIKKDLQFLENIFENPDSAKNDYLVTEITGYKTIVSSHEGKFYIRLDLKISEQGKRFVYMLFLEDIEDVKASHDSNEILIYYPMSKLEFILKQLDTGNCKLFYNYEHKRAGLNIN